MATITLKNIPADLHRELKKRAEERHRSLNREVLATLRVHNEPLPVAAIASAAMDCSPAGDPRPRHSPNSNRL
jgi:plasmid stability protein